MNSLLRGVNKVDDRNSVIINYAITRFPERFRQQLSVCRMRTDTKCPGLYTLGDLTVIGQIFQYFSSSKTFRRQRALHLTCYGDSDFAAT